MVLPLALALAMAVARPVVRGPLGRARPTGVLKQAQVLAEGNVAAYAWLSPTRLIILRSSGSRTPFRGPYRAYTVDTELGVASQLDWLSDMVTGWYLEACSMSASPDGRFVVVDLFRVPGYRVPSVDTWPPGARGMLPFDCAPIVDLQERECPFIMRTPHGDLFWTGARDVLVSSDRGGARSLARWKLDAQSWRSEPLALPAGMRAVIGATGDGILTASSAGDHTGWNLQTVRMVRFSPHTVSIPSSSVTVVFPSGTQVYEAPMSPDGRLVAWQLLEGAQWRLCTSGSGGESMESIGTARYGQAMHTLRWTPDGRNLCFLYGDTLYSVTVPPGREGPP